MPSSDLCPHQPCTIAEPKVLSKVCLLHLSLVSAALWLSACCTWAC